MYQDCPAPDPAWRGPWTHWIGSGFSGLMDTFMTVLQLVSQLAEFVVVTASAVAGAIHLVRKRTRKKTS